MDDSPKDPDSDMTVVRVKSNISKHCFKKKCQKHQKCHFVLKFTTVAESKKKNKPPNQKTAGP